MDLEINKSGLSGRSSVITGSYNIKAGESELAGDVKMEEFRAMQHKDSTLPLLALKVEEKGQQGNWAASGSW